MNSVTSNNDIRCQQPAEWELYGKDPYDITYSCTKHLSQMVADDTVLIREYKYERSDDEICCFMAQIGPD